MSQIGRELKVVYGTLTVGGSSSPGSTRPIQGIHLMEKRFEEFVLEFTFIISQSSEALFGSEIDTIEDAFSKPFQDLVLTQGSTDIYSFKQSNNTGLDAKPEILKREDSPAQTGRSRKYTVRIVVGLPANTGAELQVGLREHSVEVAYDPARIRTVTVAGVVTANSTSNARTQYEAIIAGLESSVFSALDIAAANRELIEEPQADHTYNTKTLNFRRVWRELIFSQAGASLNDTDIVRQVLTIARQKVGPGDSSRNVRRLVTLTATYNAWLDKSNTNLKSKYENTIRNWIVSQAKNLVSGSIALIEDHPDFNFDENHISATLTMLATGGSRTFEYSIATEDFIKYGKVLVSAWTRNVLSKHMYQGPATWIRTFTQTGRFLGTETDAQAYRFGAMKEILSQNFKHDSTRAATTPKTLGIDGYTFDIVELMQVDVFEGFVPIGKIPNDQFIPSGTVAPNKLI